MCEEHEGEQNRRKQHRGNDRRNHLILLQIPFRLSYIIYPTHYHIHNNCTDGSVERNAIHYVQRPVLEWCRFSHRILIRVRRRYDYVPVDLQGLQHNEYDHWTHPNPHIPYMTHELCRLRIIHHHHSPLSLSLCLSLPLLSILGRGPTEKR